MQTKEQQQSQKSMEKSIIYGLMDEKRHSFRKGFVRYITERYGVNPYTAYPKLRKGRFHRWEVEGIASCLATYENLIRQNQDQNQDKYIGYAWRLMQGNRTQNDWRNFYDSMKNKSDFVRFMSFYGMGQTTVRRRFANFKFSDIEMRGWENVYREYLAFGGMQ